MKKLAIVLTMVAFIAACGNNDTDNAAPASDNDAVANNSSESENPSYDPKRGEGKFKDVQVAEQLDAAMADAGHKVYEVKCSSCHKLTDERLVGPGWQGVTDRHTADWIMNFSTNTDADAG